MNEKNFLGSLKKMFRGDKPKEEFIPRIQVKDEKILFILKNFDLIRLNIFKQRNAVSMTTFV